ncbi:MAG: GbsR/MarR family transcriptional regulator [Myxococcaceae bacterium]
MKGYAWTETSDAPVEVESIGQLARWEAIAADAVGQVIEFWGFKRNHGRVWALLYLRGQPLSAQHIEQELGLSKGGVSMWIRDLERWGVVLRVREPSSAAWFYRAEIDLLRMVRRVLEEREAGLIARIRADLLEAKRLAGLTPTVRRDALARLDRMLLVAQAAEKALRAFVKTAQLDLGQVVRAFRDVSG